jgi:hypothetical protein
LNVATIHRTLVKEHAKNNQVWLREIKQLRPKAENSKELVLVSAAPEPNRRDRKKFEAIFKANRRKFAHVVFKLRQRLKHPTAHQMPKQRPGCFGNISNALTSAQVATAESS